MKKLVALLICAVFFTFGCGKQNREDIVHDLKNSINNSKAYKLTGTMEISNDEETFTYSIESNYLKDNYYKVKLVNQTNNHEQIILRNNEDVYVITPALNKSFKFQSDWPDNSSQAYLPKSIIKDIENDNNYELETNDNGYVIKSSVNYPNNNELKYQKIYLDNDKNLKKVEVYNNNDLVKIKVDFNEIDLKADLKTDDFNIEEYIKEDNSAQNTEDNKAVDQENTKNNEKCETDECSNKKTANIENIIYPLYIPSNTYLTSSEKIDTSSGNRVILTFSGEKNFVLIEEASLKHDNMEVVPVYGEPLMMNESVGALSSNSLSWDNGNISYYLASTELSSLEMQSIANSLGNNVLVAKTK